MAHSGWGKGYQPRPGVTPPCPPLVALGVQKPLISIFFENGEGCGNKKSSYEDFFRLGAKDSNLYKQIQSLLSCR